MPKWDSIRVRNSMFSCLVINRISRDENAINLASDDELVRNLFQRVL